jgi:hypothetical protein
MAEEQPIFSFFRFSFFEEKTCRQPELHSTTPAARHPQVF